MENKKKTIRNLDSNDQHHGYQELYANNIIFCRGNSKHGKDIGYQEYHYSNETEYHII